MKISKMVWSKLTSARYIMSILVAVTLCILANKSFSLLISASSKDANIFAQAKEICMFVLGAFITSAQSIITSYFQRSDRDTPTKDEPATVVNATKVDPTIVKTTI